MQTRKEESCSEDEFYQEYTSIEWGKSVAPLQQIVKFFENKEEYKPPLDHKLIFEAYFLGNFLAVLEFITVLCDSLEWMNQNISNGSLPQANPGSYKR